jgi:hypothetical protein
MIQRIQTVWLFLASGTLLLLFLFPYLQYFDNYGVGMAIKITGIYQGVSEGVIQVESNILQTIATVVIALIPLLTISFFRDRTKQIKLILINIFVVFLLGLWFFFTARNAVQLVNKSIAIENIGIGSLLVPLSIVFLVLAIKGIRNDDKLIKSVDRLRG